MWISRQTREPGCLYTGRKRGVYLSGEHNKRNTIRLRRALPRRLGRTSIFLLFSLPFNTSVNYWLVHGTTRIFIRLGRKSLSLSSLAVQGVSIYIAFDIVLDLPSRCYSTESQKNFFFPPTSSSISKTSSFPYSILLHVLLFLYFLFCFRNNVAGYGRPTDSFRNWESQSPRLTFVAPLRLSISLRFKTIASLFFFSLSDNVNIS